MYTQFNSRPANNCTCRFIFKTLAVYDLDQMSYYGGSHLVGYFTSIGIRKQTSILYYCTIQMPDNLAEVVV